MNKRRISFIVLILLLLISVGYATLSTILKVNGTTNLAEVSYLVIFDNVRLSGNNIHPTDTATIDSNDRTKMNFNLNLENPDDYFVIDFNMVNVGTLIAKLTKIDLGISDPDMMNLVNIEILDENDQPLEEGLIIHFLDNKIKHGRIKISYDLPDDITLEDLNNTGKSFDLTMNFTFEYGNIINEDYLLEMLDIEPTNESEESSRVFIHSVDFSKNPTKSMMVYDYKLDEYGSPTHIYSYHRDNIDDHNNFIINGICWKYLSTSSYTSLEEDPGGGGIKGGNTPSSKSQSKDKFSPGTKGAGSDYEYPFYIRALYNGHPNDQGQCMDTGEDVFIGKSSYSSTGSFNFDQSDVLDTIGTWLYETFDEENRIYLKDVEMCNSNTYEPNNPSNKCNEEDILKYPAGLLTADEANIHGLTINESNNTYIGTNAAYWTMTGASNNKIWAVGNKNNIIQVNSTELLGIRPVVNFDAEELENNFYNNVYDCNGIASYEEFEACISSFGTKEHPILYEYMSVDI